MKRALMSPKDTTWFYRPKKGRYRRRTDVPISKPTRGKYRRVDSQFAGADYLEGMPSKPIELPPDFARRFAEDMRAWFAETNLIKRDEIAARQLHALRQHYPGKLRLIDVAEMFLQLRDQA